MSARGPLQPAEESRPPEIAPLQFGNVRFHDAPQMPGYPVFDLDLVSAQLPSGAAWLGNCLLELGAPLWNPWRADTRGEWTHLGGRRFHYERPGDPWRRVFPTLVSGRDYEFRPSPVPRMMHDWPGLRPMSPQVILFVRDPRDAVFSGWRRHATGQGWAVDDAERFVGYAGGGLFDWPFSVADYWALFHAAWLAWLEATPDVRWLVVRYEDYRRDAAATLREVCRFLQLAVDEEAVARAVGVSDFDNLRQIEADMLRRGVFPTPIMHAGQSCEYRQRYTAQMLSVFSRRVAEPARRFGYEPLPEAGPVPPMSAQAWLRAIGVPPEPPALALAERALQLCAGDL